MYPHVYSFPHWTCQYSTCGTGLNTEGCTVWFSEAGLSKYPELGCGESHRELIKCGSWCLGCITMWLMLTTAFPVWWVPWVKLVHSSLMSPEQQRFTHAVPTYSGGLRASCVTLLAQCPWKVAPGCPWTLLMSLALGWFCTHLTSIVCGGKHGISEHEQMFLRETCNF